MSYYYNILAEKLDFLSFRMLLSKFRAFGIFVLLAETSFLCICIMDKEWYRSFLSFVNNDDLKKVIFYSV